MKKCYLFCLLLAFNAIAFSQVVLPVPKHRFTVIAHRGDHTEAPENTLAGYNNAITNGVDYVEIDLRTTKDSALVIMHDAIVDRMTDGKGKVSDLTLAEIKQLKVHDKSKSDTQAYSIPTFEEVLKLCKGKIYIYLDFKNASVQQAYNMIVQYNMQHDIIVYINAPNQYTDWKKVAPAMPLMLSLPGNVKTSSDLTAFITKTPVALLDGDYTDYTADILTTATAAGIAAWPDIQSPGEAANWDKAISLGFKGLQTDHPKALIDYLHSKGLR